MKKLLLPLAIGSALSLVGCGSGDEAPLTEEEINIAATRVQFDPSNSIIPAPTNVLLSGTVDGTLNIPVADPSDSSDPQVALNGLDGWGTHPTMTFNFSLPRDENGDLIAVAASSVEAQGAIRVFETIQGGSDVSAECAAASPAAACAVTAELTHGVDFTVSAVDEDTVAVVPLRPLKPKTGYIVALTSNIQDELGRDVHPSQTYTLMKRPADSDPVSSDPSAVSLQRLINSYEGALAQFGVDAEDVIYASNFTTQSVGDVLGATKQMLALSAAGVDTPWSPEVPVMQAAPQGYTLDVVLQQNGVTDPAALAAASAARVYGGQVNLPYYSPLPTAENPTAPIDGRWQAACDSPASILGAIEQGVIDPAGAGIPAEALEDPSLLLPPNNCFDFPGVDNERHLTKYNPVPAIQGTQTVPAFITIPDLATVNAIRAQRGMAELEAVPQGGWPVVIFQHGITGEKTNAAGIAGSLAAAGFATVAIDHPLHGDRAFGAIDASSPAGVTAYMNLANLLGARDNIRQSIADLVGLRMSLNNFMAADGAQLNGQDVHFVGHSLGAIAGVGFTALANTPLSNPQLEPLSPMFEVQASSFGMPGGSIANFLLASGSFEVPVKSQLLYSASAEFAEVVNAQAEAAGVTPGGEGFSELLAQVYTQFIDGASDAERAQINATFEQFAFAAQAVIDSADPVNYSAGVVATETPVHLIEAVGDATIPNAVAGKPLAGTEPLIGLMGLPSVSATVQSEDGNPVSGAVRFSAGDHASLVSPEASAAATTEMQTQIFSWFGSDMLMLPVTNEDVVQ
ncbi:alpha/beta hydrolase [Idiomarina sp. OT37-5b]|uniref:VolA/Pla-1 family phospholipase n=1 Tax=Idiomarina sp. OT37-5b TaxID=2100422 RepID=UPI000CFA1F82|nr:VolA/Pla-1 family phospholipase [Idiomarina sp. OT37-5b]AVJ55466.1 alpha/beta hydrolase [Idiomarina sp. OT37-5b]